MNHFLQPDTIIPNLANPQSWNRFTYVLNNPMRYNDPTGHKEVSETEGVLSQETMKKYPCAGLRGLVLDICLSGPKKPKTEKDIIKGAADRLAWLTIPSVIGIDYGIQLQYGLFAEAEVTPYERQILYNWRSGQLSVLEGSGTGGYLGSPTILGLTGYVGVMTVYGASDNSYVAGHSKQVGGTAQADVVATAGINKVVGASWDQNNKKPFVDPVSNLPVIFRQTNIVGGLNIFPDGFDLGIFAGQSDSEIKR